MSGRATCIQDRNSREGLHRPSPSNLGSSHNIRRAALTSLPTRILHPVLPARTPPPQHSPPPLPPLDSVREPRYPPSQDSSVRTPSPSPITDVSDGTGPIRLTLSLNSSVPQRGRESRVEDRIEMSLQRYNIVWQETEKQWMDRHGTSFPYLQDQRFRRRVEFGFSGTDDSPIMSEWRTMWESNDEDWTEFKLVAHLREESMRQRIYLWQETGQYHSQTMELWERFTTDDSNRWIAATRQGINPEITSREAMNVFSMPKIKRDESLGRENRDEGSNAWQAALELYDALSHSGKSRNDNDTEFDPSHSSSQASSAANIREVLSLDCNMDYYRLIGLEELMLDYDDLSGSGSGDARAAPEFTQRRSGSQDAYSSSGSSSIVTHRGIKDADSPILPTTGRYGQLPELDSVMQQGTTTGFSLDWHPERDDCGRLEEQPETTGDEWAEMAYTSGDATCADLRKSKATEHWDIGGKSSKVNHPQETSAPISNWPWITHMDVEYGEEIERVRRSTSILDAWRSYELRWSTFATAYATQRIGFSDIPWPMVQTPSGSESMTSQAVSELILSPLHSVGRTRKERLREALLKWNPDTFEHRWLGFILEDEKPRVVEAVEVLYRILIQLWTEVDQSSALHLITPIPKLLRDSPTIGKSMCAQISRGLAYLHEIGVVHGDIKGANVLVLNDGTPVLTDFGNSLFSGSGLDFTITTQANNLTIRWAAPELLGETGERSKEADVYALGMTILELITGRLPYDGKSDLAIVSLVHQRKYPERPEDLIPTQSQDGDRLWELLLACWAYEPKKAARGR
ncbi:hypothetical protein OPQ81_000806 [Rhizoctonia solani]|nr:hypothetical protein OPQ81_000806 [Rhizoctonia solani]